MIGDSEDNRTHELVANALQTVSTDFRRDTDRASCACCLAEGNERDVQCPHIHYEPNTQPWDSDWPPASDNGFRKSCNIYMVCGLTYTPSINCCDCGRTLTRPKFPDIFEAARSTGLGMLSSPISTKLSIAKTLLVVRCSKKHSRKIPLPSKMDTSSSAFHDSGKDWGQKKSPAADSGGTNAGWTTTPRKLIDIQSIIYASYGKSGDIPPYGV